MAGGAEPGARFSLWNRSRTVIAVGALILATLAAAAVTSAWRSGTALERRRVARDRAVEVATADSAITDQQLVVLRAAAAGRPVDAADLASGRTTAETALASLRAAAGQWSGAAPVVANADAWRAWLDRVVTSGAVPDAAALDAAAAPVRTALQRLGVESRAELSLDDRRAARWQQRARWSLGGFLAAVLAIAVVGVVLLRRAILRPLATIADTAARLSTDQSGPASGVATFPAQRSAEMQRLSEAVSTMHADLRSSRDEAVRALQAMTQSAVLAIHVRSELAPDEEPVRAAGWSFATSMRAAEGLAAGDCSDVALLDEHHVYVLLLDVTGHGALAAVTALTTKSLLRSALRAGLSPGHAIRWTWEHGERREEAGYLTAFVARIDLNTGRCTYANAGHPPALVTSGETIAELGATGPLVGPFDATWEDRTVVLDMGAVMLIHSDGLTDAVDRERNRFGEQAVQSELVTACRDPRADASATLDHLARRLDHHAASYPDDVTVVCIAHRPPSDARQPPLLSSLVGNV